MSENFDDRPEASFHEQPRHRSVPAQPGNHQQSASYYYYDFLTATITIVPMIIGLQCPGFSFLDFTAVSSSSSNSIRSSSCSSSSTRRFVVVVAVASKSRKE